MVRNKYLLMYYAGDVSNEPQNIGSIPFNQKNPFYSDINNNVFSYTVYIDESVTDTTITKFRIMYIPALDDAIDSSHVYKSGELFMFMTPAFVLNFTYTFGTLGLFSGDMDGNNVVNNTDNICPTHMVNISKVAFPTLTYLFLNPNILILLMKWEYRNNNKRVIATLAVMNNLVRIFSFCVRFIIKQNGLLLF